MRASRILQHPFNRTARSARWLQELEYAHFDLERYAQQAREYFSSPDAAVAHFRRVGVKAGLLPNPLFDPLYYLKENPDLEGVEDPFAHFLGIGQDEGRRPHPLFSIEWIKRVHAACDSSEPPWQHVQECHLRIATTPLWRTESRSHEDYETFLNYASTRGISHTAVVTPLFDREFFAEVETSADDSYECDSLYQYASTTGERRRGAPPSPLFDSSFFMSIYGDQLRQDTPLLEAYLETGVELAWQPHPDVHPKVWEKAFGEQLDLASQISTVRSADGNRETAKIDALIIDIDSFPTTFMSVAHLLRSASQEIRDLIVIENDSATENEAGTLRKYIPSSRVLTLTARRSFGEANNIGVESSGAPYLLLLNNDAFVWQGTVEHLREQLDSDASLSAVGPTLLFPDGQVQESGGLITPDGLHVQLYKYVRSREEIPHSDSLRKCDYVSAACVLVRREAFEQVEGFSYRYEPAYFEDTDLCRRLSDIGPIGVLGGSFATHLEGLSTGRLLDDKAALVDIGTARFRQDVRTSGQTYALVAEEGREAGESAKSFPADSKFLSGLTCWLYSPYPLAPGGGERYLLGMAQAFAALGADTSLVLNGQYSQMRLRQVSSALRLSLPSVRVEPLETAYLRPRPDLFVSMGNSLAPPLEALGAVSFYHCQFPFPQPHRNVLRSIHRLSEYSGVIVNSEYTRGHYRRALDRIGMYRQVDVIHPPCGAAKEAKDTPRSGILTLSRLTRQGHSKKLDRLLAAFGEFHEQAPQTPVTLTIAGAAPSEAPSQVVELLNGIRAHPDARVVLDPGPELVDELLGRSQILWHGAGWGSRDTQPWDREHFGIAVVEAMNHGTVPLAHASAGPAEILRGLEEHCLYDSQSELLTKTRKLLEDSNLWRELSVEVMRRAQTFTDSHFRSRIKQLLVRYGVTEMRGAHVS